MEDHEYQALLEKHEMAYFRADLATSSPESYSIEEKQQIIGDMQRSTADLEAAMRADFQLLPVDIQDELFEMICDNSVEPREFWDRILRHQS